MHRNVCVSVTASSCILRRFVCFEPEARAPLKVAKMPPSAQNTDRSVGAVFLRLLRDPLSTLFKRWNWKSALLSSLLRSAIFFFANLSAGLPAALAATETELFFRAISSGFYGALTESFCEARPPWAATLAVAVFLPF